MECRASIPSTPTASPMGLYILGALAMIMVASLFAFLAVVVLVVGRDGRESGHTAVSWSSPALKSGVSVPSPTPPNTFP